MNERLEEIKICESMKETILKMEPDEDKHWLINRVQELEEENEQIKVAYQDRCDDLEAMRELLGVEWEDMVDE